MKNREKITAYLEKKNLQETQEKLVSMLQNMSMSTVVIEDEDTYQAVRVDVELDEKTFEIYEYIKNGVLDTSCENNWTMSNAHELRDFLEESVGHERYLMHLTYAVENYIYDEIQKRLDADPKIF
jgi:hypothetical protein